MHRRITGRDAYQDVFRWHATSVNVPRPLSSLGRMDTLVNIAVSTRRDCRPGQSRIWPLPGFRARRPRFSTSMSWIWPYRAALPVPETPAQSRVRVLARHRRGRSSRRRTSTRHPDGPGRPGGRSCKPRRRRSSPRTSSTSTRWSCAACTCCSLSSTAPGGCTWPESPPIPRARGCPAGP